MDAVDAMDAMDAMDAVDAVDAVLCSRNEHSRETARSVARESAHLYRPSGAYLFLLPVLLVKDL